MNQTAPDALAEQLGVSVEAVELTRQIGAIDLHLDTFIPMRLFGYDPLRRHKSSWFRKRYMGHLDLPRAIDGGLHGAMWSITTQPFRGERGRWKTFLKNVGRFQRWVEESGSRVQLVRNFAEFQAARAAGSHACMLSVQGGNSLAGGMDRWGELPDKILTRVTLVHLTRSTFGSSSTPTQKSGAKAGLTARGHQLVELLNHERIFVDLAHIDPKGFWDAIERHDPSQPILCTHTGVNAVRKSWRNLEDNQIRAVADLGGTIGIIFHKGFLARKGGPRDHEMVLEHMEHVIHICGDDFVSIGSDYDGMISPPRGLRSADSYPRLVQSMLNRRWTFERIQKVLAGNFLRALKHIRGE